jgi:hypothetical protein
LGVHHTYGSALELTILELVLYIEQIESAMVMCHDQNCRLLFVRDATEQLHYGAPSRLA